MNINQPITGTICINHFSADDIITNITLAKGTIPTIAANLPSENRENSIDTNAAEHNGANNCQAECCQKAVSKLNDVIANLEKSNSELLVGFHKKTQLMLRQIEYYKKTMNALQDRLTPSNLVLYKNRDKSGELNRKVKRLQDAIQYRNRRIKTINENRKMERLESQALLRYIMISMRIVRECYTRWSSFLTCLCVFQIIVIYGKLSAKLYRIRKRYNVGMRILMSPAKRVFKRIIYKS